MKALPESIPQTSQEELRTIDGPKRQLPGLKSALDDIEAHEIESVVPCTSTPSKGSPHALPLPMEDDDDVDEDTPPELNPFTQVFPHYHIATCAACCMKFVFGPLSDYDFNWAESPLFFIPAQSGLRKGLVRLVDSFNFRMLIIATILGNSIVMAVDDPLTIKALPNVPVVDIANGLDVFFTACFTVDCVLQICARGFILHPYAYMRTGWNIVDFVVVVSSLFDTVPGIDVDVSVIRMVRLLRPLRTLKAVPQLKLIIDTILDSGKYLLDVCCVMLFVVVLAQHSSNAFCLCSIRFYNELFVKSRRS